MAKRLSPFQVLGLRASSVAITAHGLPVLPSPGPVAIPSTSRLDNVDDTAPNIVGTVSEIVKEVAEMLNDVPYVKTLTGVILQIIKVKEV